MATVQTPPGMVIYRQVPERVYMIRTGKVIRAEGEDLQVCFEPLQSCENCGMCGGRKESTVALKGKARAGDWVDVQMPDARVLKASAVTYLLPLTGLIAGIALGTVLFPQSDVAAFIAGGLGLAAALLALKAIDRRVGKDEQWQPRVVAVRPPEESPGAEALPKADEMNDSLK